jgi:hypothetical protein
MAKKTDEQVAEQTALPESAPEDAKSAAKAGRIVEQVSDTMFVIK